MLLNAINHKTGLVTFHVNDLMWGFGRDPAPYERDEFIVWLVEGTSGEITCPNTVLPVGGNARLNADQCSLEILEPCVL